MRLVIVESPKKARTIQGFLGSGYKVAASMGHVRDLPPKDLGIDLAHDFAPQYVVLPRAQTALSALRRSVAGAESVLLATDPDREGEAIAWHLAHALRLARSRYRRITFHEISRRAIQEALAHPRDLDPHLIDAQQARRVLDRLVGYQLSPLLWRKVQRGTSAGRVQSVAVKLVVDREREILAFVPEEYWTIDVQLSTLPSPTRGEGPGVRGLRGGGRAGGESFLARLQEVDGKKAEIPNAEVAHALEAALREAAYTVRDTGQKTVTRNPFPPFTTSTLQQAAGNRLRFPAKKTMSAAQGLYEAGLVTYMRTDSVAVSASAIAQAREVIGAEFGPEYVPDSPRRYSTKAKNAQEAHEAIRPVDLRKAPAALRAALAPDEWRIYELIWKRMIASQMPPARYLQDVALIDGETLTPQPPLPETGEGERTRRNGTSLPNATAYLPSPTRGEGPGVRGSSDPRRARDPEDPPAGAGWRGEGHRFLLKAQATTLVFPGWLAAYGEEPAPAQPSQTQRRRGAAGETDNADESDAPANERLPQLRAGQPLEMEDVLPAQHFTQPPRRYSEASLVKALEEAGVGRPSTYATVVSTIQDRGYVQLQQRHFVPTELGFAANDFLVAHFPRIVDLPFTAEMEDSLDEIAAGKLQWTQMLHVFYGPFADTLKRAQTAPVSPVKQHEATGEPPLALPAAAPAEEAGEADDGTPPARNLPTSAGTRATRRVPRATGATGRSGVRSAAATRRGYPGAEDAAWAGPLTSRSGTRRPGAALAQGAPPAALPRRTPATPLEDLPTLPLDDEPLPPTRARDTRTRQTARSTSRPPESAPKEPAADGQEEPHPRPPRPGGDSIERAPRQESLPGISTVGSRADTLGVPLAEPPAPPGGQVQPLCPQCGRPLTVRTSQYGLFIGCSGFPACRYIHRDQPPAPRTARPAGRGRRPAALAGPPPPLTRNVVRRKSRGT